MLVKISKIKFSKFNKIKLERDIASFYNDYCQKNILETKKVHLVVQNNIKLKYFDRFHEIIFLHFLSSSYNNKEEKLDKEFIKLVGTNQTSFLNDLISVLTIESINSDFLNKFLNKIKLTFNHWKNKFFSNIREREQRKEFKEKFIDSFQIYNESLQEIVEGQREINHNKEFKFDDGETTEQKKENFRKNFKNFLNKASSAFQNRNL